MCGRYSLALVRRMLENNDMPVWEAPEDEGDGAPRQSYNFAPGYHGVVYRADVPDWGAGPRRERGAGKAAGKVAETEGADTEDTPNTPAKAQTAASSGELHYKLQSMKWGLIPFWTKRNPDYGSMLKTINCRDDSLATAGGMWASMKARKRCIVIAQGFYEWLKVGKDKVPHFVKRKDGHLMCFAGLWDVVQYEDDEQKNYTYTIITTDSNKQLKFLHDRMPVILDHGSEKMKRWLDPSRYEWSKELQDLLKPFDGELEVYPVSKEVGKVGNNSPSFIIPIASKENKSNIANFFANAKGDKKDGQVATSPSKVKAEVEIEVKKEPGNTPVTETKTLDEIAQHADDGGMTHPLGTKRTAVDELPDQTPTKKLSMQPSPSPTKPKTQSPSKLGRAKISATSNNTKSPAKSKSDGSQKITKFFANSS